MGYDLPSTIFFFSFATSLLYCCCCCCCRLRDIDPSNSRHISSSVFTPFLSLSLLRLFFFYIFFYTIQVALLACPACVRVWHLITPSGVLLNRNCPSCLFVLLHELQASLPFPPLDELMNCIRCAIVVYPSQSVSLSLVF